MIYLRNCLQLLQLLTNKLLFSAATRAAYGDAHTEEPCFKQLVSCNVKLQLHETCASIGIMKIANAYAEFQENTASYYPT